MAAAKYQTGDIVYIRESAAKGFLESRKIQVVLQYNGEWAYGFNINERTPAAIPTIGDQINHQFKSQLYVSENELITYCEALSLNREFAARLLASIDAKIAASDC